MNKATVAMRYFINTARIVNSPFPRLGTLSRSPASPSSRRPKREKMTSEALSKVSYIYFVVFMISVISVMTVVSVISTYDELDFEICNLHVGFYGCDVRVSLSCR